MYQDLKNIVLEINSNYNLQNKYIYDLLEKVKKDEQYQNKDKILEQYVLLEKDKINKKKEIDKFNKEKKYNNSFAEKGIYTLNDLYKYMNDNFEYGGVVSLNNRRHKLPFGLVNGPAKYNKIYNYNDENVFRFIIKIYRKLDSNVEVVNKVLKQYRDNPSEITLSKEYQKIIYQVGDYAQRNLWHHRSVDEILNDQISNCYESTFLVGEFLKLMKIDYQKYIIGRYDNLALSHMFITYKAFDKYYYFEHALRDFKGIYSYDTIEELEHDIFNKYIYYDNNSLSKDIDYSNYFLKPIDDLNTDDRFDDYLNYFNTISSIECSTGIYNRLISLTDLVFKGILGIGTIYDNGINMFYNDINLPSKEDCCDIELWKTKIHKIIRKHIVNIGFYVINEKYIIYSLDANNGFIKYDNIISIDDSTVNSQLLYSKDKTSNVFRISYLDKLLKDNNISYMKEILMYSASLNNKKDLYDYGCFLVTALSNNLLKSINNNHKYVLWNNELINLSGDIEVISGITTLDNILSQVSKIAVAIKTLSDSIYLITNKDYSTDFVNCFNDYLVYMLDVSNIDVSTLRNNVTVKGNKFVDTMVTNLLNKLIQKTNNN